MRAPAWPQRVDRMLGACADPVRASTELSHLVGIDPELPGRLADDPGFASRLVTVLAASRSLALACLRPGAMDVVADPRPLGKITPKDPQSLLVWKEVELLRIAVRDLCGLDRFEAVGTALAQLADGVARVALDLAGVEGIAVIGMGKLGGSELNYSSDIDVMVVGDPGRDQSVRAALEIMRKCFRVDLDLRPEGRSGTLIRSVESFQSYWARWAEPWEFQALMKARPIAGSAEVGGAFARAAEEALWDRVWGAEELRQLRGLKARAEQQMSNKGLSERELKRGRGGIRDVEFSVQLLQLVHGGRDRALRSPNTLSALTQLSQGGYVAASDAWAMADDYRFLRTVEHRLQIEYLHQVHTLPEQGPALQRLARVLGYGDDRQMSAAQRLSAELRRRQHEVRSIHERLWFRPLLDAFAGGGGIHASPPGATMAPEAVAAQLAALGFTNLAQTSATLSELTRGLTRSSRLMAQMLALMLDWLSVSADPDLGLLGLRRITRGTHRSEQVVTLCRDSPEAARRLCTVLGSGRSLVDALETEPGLLAELSGPISPDAWDAEDAALAATGALRSRRAGSAEKAGPVLARFRRMATARVAITDVLGATSVEETGSALASVAEGLLRVALEVLPPPVPLAIFAMGRFGARGLSYASDIDVVLVANPPEPSSMAKAEEHAAALAHLLAGPSPVDQVLPLDLSLRPHGRDGPLVRSIAAYRSYFGNWAQTWERQAHLLARPVAGDGEVQAAFMEVVGEFVWGRPFGEGEVREVRRLKARMEKERIPAGQDPQFHLKLGRGSLSDVEWTVQLLQLQTGVTDNNTHDALVALVAHGALSEHEADILGSAHRFCEAARNRLFLLNGRPADYLPPQPEMLTKLARSLNTTPGALREDYRRVTRRAREVMDRRFWNLG